MTLRWPRVSSVAASELELGVPERKEPDEGDDIQPWCTPVGPAINGDIHIKIDHSGYGLHMSIAENLRGMVAKEGVSASIAMKNDFFCQLVTYCAH